MPALLPGQDLRRSLSGPSPSLTASGMWGAQQPLEFAWVDPGHGMEAEACGCSGRNRSPGKTSVSPTKTTWPSLDSAVTHGGDPAHPQHRHEVFRSWLSGCCWPPFCPNGPQALHSTPSRTSGQRATVWESRPPHKQLAGWWSHGWLEPNKGRTWDLPPAAAIGEPPRGPHTLCRLHSLLTLGFWTLVFLYVYLLPLD